MKDEDVQDGIRRQILEMERVRGMFGQGLNSSVASSQYIPGNHTYAGAQAASTQDLMKSITSLNMAVVELRGRLARMEGFYAWVMHTYPEKFAEFQAMEDFKRICDESDKK